jgi:hypothetical protein
MHPRFSKAVSSLDTSYKALVKMKPVTIGTMPKGMPTCGVYLFSEGKKHLYVGRSNKLHKRPLRHCGTHRMAAFAFRLAREATGFINPSYRSGEESRKGLMENPRFVGEFNKAKDRIRKMDLRFVEEGDQTRQALLEIYCAVALKAPYNDFNTH